MKASLNFPNLRTTKERETIREKRRMTRNQRTLVNKKQWGLRTYNKQDGICAYCKKHIDLIFWTVDHIIPIAKGGRTKKQNLIGACKTCNMLKGDRSRSVYSWGI